MKVGGKVAIVTGAAGGIGAALARRLTQEGAAVALADLDRERLDAVVADIEGRHPGAAIGVAGDVCDSEQLRTLLARTEQELGPVDLYCANAGVGGGTGMGDEDEWDQAVGVNLLAHVRAARLLLPGWLERGRGYFLATASAAGLLTQIGSAPYSVTKHAAVGFAEWLSVTYGDRGVGVSCLCPMGVNTAMLNGSIDSGERDREAGARAVTEAGVVLEPEDVATAVVEALAEERFLVLPHEEVLELYRRKGQDYERWLRGMRRLQDRVS